jgi:hypothetical protein
MPVFQQNRCEAAIQSKAAKPLAIQTRTRQAHWSSARIAAVTDPIDSFVLSLDRPEAPPFATRMLRAVWHGLRGEWDAAHELAQAQDDAEGAWVHAWLHRLEGDLGNADYWYQRAHRPSRRGDTRDEGLEIARALIRPTDSV